MFIEEIKKKCYPQNKKEQDFRVSLWVFYFIRPISFYLTFAAYRLKINPNQATFIGLFFGLIAILFAFESYFICAAIFLNIFAIIDCIDGNLARLGNPSKKGEYYDAFFGDLVNFSFPVIFLFAAYRDGLLDSVRFFGDEVLLILIFLISFILMLTALASQRLKIIFNDSESSNNKNYKLKPSIAEIIVRNGYGAAYLYPMAILTAIFNIFDIMFLFVTYEFNILYFLLIRVKLV